MYTENLNNKVGIRGLGVIHNPMDCVYLLGLFMFPQNETNLNELISPEQLAYILAVLEIYEDLRKANNE